MPRNNVTDAFYVYSLSFSQVFRVLHRSSFLQNARLFIATVLMINIWRLYPHFRRRRIEEVAVPLPNDNCALRMFVIASFNRF